MIRKIKYVCGQMLGHFWRREGFENEHKEYRFPKHSFPDARSLLNVQGVHSFIDESVSEIQRFLDKNIGKYFSSIGNSPMEWGYLNLGVSDDGLLTGIPIPDELIFDDFRVVKNWVYHSIQDVLLKPYNLHNIGILRDIEVDIKLLQVEPSDFTEDIEPLIELYERETKAYETGKRDYAKAMRKFEEEIQYYKGSINAMLNDPQKWGEFLTYVQSRNPEMAREFYHQKIEQFEVGQIMKEKGDEGKLAHWITQYRDLQVTRLQLKKPTKPYLIKPTDIYYMLSKNYNLLISTLVKAGISFIKVSIKFPGHRPGRLPILYESKRPSKCTCDCEAESSRHLYVLERGVNDVRGPFTYRGERITKSQHSSSAAPLGTH